MAADTRVSAFAKRRRLNDGTPATSTYPSSDSATSTQPVKKPRAKKPVGVQATKVIEVKETCIVTPVANTTEEHSAENSFEPLVEAQVVQFSGVREIDQLDEHNYKIRLSRGQRCTINGIARLWVREGSIVVYGAHIHESTKTYTLFGLASDAFSGIEATSQLAEFQLESISLSDSSAPSTLNVPGKIGKQARKREMSFEVADLASEMNVMPSKGTSNVFPKLGKQQAVQANSEDRSDSNHRIVVRGRKPTETARAAVFAINHLLSVHRHEEVAFLDLEPSAPAFTFPGTISLVRARHVVLGPSYTSPLPAHSLHEQELVSSYYVGAVHRDDAIGSSFDLIEGLLTSPEIRRLPLVARIGERVSTISSPDLNRIHKLISPVSTYLIDRFETLPVAEAAIVESSAVDIMQIPQNILLPMSSLAEHRNSLRAHFYLYGFIDGSPLWRQPSASTAEARLRKLIIGKQTGQLAFVMVLGAVIREQDVFEALEGAIVHMAATSVGVTTGQADSQSLEIRRHSSEHDLHHIGMGVVHRIDETVGSLWLETSVSEAQLGQFTNTNFELGLILEKPSEDGWCSRHQLFG